MGYVKYGKVDESPRTDFFGKPRLTTQKQNPGQNAIMMGFTNEQEIAEDIENNRKIDMNEL